MAEKQPQDTPTTGSKSSQIQKDQTTGSHDASTAAATKDSFTLTWREGRMTPHDTSRGSDAVADSESLYLKFDSYDILQYNPRYDTWSRLPDCRMDCCCLAIVNNRLTAIGGGSRRYHMKPSNKLLSLKGEGRNKKWKEVYPPMPTPRLSPTALNTGSALIVAGGYNEDEMISKVEIMDIKTRQWSTAEDLLEPFAEASATICNDHIYVGGGWIEGGHANCVYTCSLADLFQSCQSKPPASKSQESKTIPPESTVWTEVAELPLKLSTFVTLHDRLLAIGGGDSNLAPSTNILIYNPTSDTWEVISKIKTCRMQCFAAVLPTTNEIVVVGGFTIKNRRTQSVEIATSKLM